MSAPSANDLYRAAQKLIREGQPVFPCRSSGAKAKTPLTKNGWKDATLDPAQAKHWWKTHGDAAIGIPTGVLWDVLDVDVKAGQDGRVHLPSLQRLGLLDGCKRVVKTPSGGWHLYFKAASGLTNKARAQLGLDVRSQGGYVLAPPSFLETEDYDGGYEDVGETTGSSDEPLMWDLIVATLAPIDTSTNKPIPLLPSERRASVASLREWVSVLKMGERNNGFHWAVSRCVESGIDPHELAEAASLTGLTDEEIMKTIGSVMRRAGVTPNDLQSEADAMFG